MIRRPVRGMRGRAHAGMSGYPANLRCVAGRRDDHLPGIKSSGVRSAVLLWSPDSGSADGRLLFGETPTSVVTAENRGTDEGFVSAYDDAPERPHRPQDARQALTDCSRKGPPRNKSGKLVTQL